MTTPAPIGETGFVVVDATWGTLRPQCAATPDAVEALLAAGYPCGALAYYRGGLHDWQTLGLPVEPGSAEA